MAHHLEETPVPFYIVEQNLNPKTIIQQNLKENPYRPFCGHCSSTGWSRHFVSKTNYHFIIPTCYLWNNPLDEGTFDLQMHLLYGLIHSNGYGHLICINGIKGGSEFICGREIMDLWDCICTSLHVRNISVKDMSMKHGMNLRLLYGVSYGDSWFGRWGYRFCHGSFGVTEYDYRMAIHVLSSLEIDKVMGDINLTDEDPIFNEIIGICRLRGVSLVTMRDLLSFMLMAIGIPPQSQYKNFFDLAVNSDRQWSIKELANVAEFLVQGMKRESKSEKWGMARMTREEARDMANNYIDDTESTEYVLKLMNNVVVGNCVVRREVNRHSKTQEYYIQDLWCENTKCPFLCPGRNVHDDLGYLYERVFFRYPSNLVKHYVEKMLQSKYFVKEFPFREEDDGSLRFPCLLTCSIDAFHGIPLGVLITVPLDATIGDLKIAVQSAIRDTYWVTEKIMLDTLSVKGDDEDVLLGLVESGSVIWVELCVVDMESELWFQGGALDRKIKCKCGTKEDDGERLIQCVGCEVWSHTRCNSTKDTERSPTFTYCRSCVLE